MLSNHAKNIIKYVDKVHKNSDIISLLQKYPDRLNRDFIQKFVETKVSFFNSKITNLAYLFALITVILANMLSISLFLYPEYYQRSKSLYELLLIIMFVFFIIALFLFIRELMKKNVFEDIIIAIEDAKLAPKEIGESIVISNLNEIDGKVDIPSTNSKSDISSINEKTNMSNVKLKFIQILEEHRWITNLIWNKINALIVVNGILFSAFNLLVMADSKSDFLIQKTSLGIVGLFVSMFWFFNLNHSIIYKENYRTQILKIQEEYPELSINFIDDHHSWKGLSGTNNVAKISTIGISVLWLMLLYGLKIGFL